MGPAEQAEAYLVRERLQGHDTPQVLASWNPETLLALLLSCMALFQDPVIQTPCFQPASQPVFPPYLTRPSPPSPTDAGCATPTRWPARSTRLSTSPSPTTGRSTCLSSTSASRGSSSSSPSCLCPSARRLTCSTRRRSSTTSSCTSVACSSWTTARWAGVVGRGCDDVSIRRVMSSTLLNAMPWPGLLRKL